MPIPEAIIPRQVEIVLPDPLADLQAKVQENSNRAIREYLQAAAMPETVLKAAAVAKTAVKWEKRVQEIEQK